MSDIQYIVLSDLHLGASNSILTKLTSDLQGTIPNEPSDVLKQYVECLLEVAISNTNDRPITLVLNGDFLELALAGINESAMVFETFITLLMSDPRASRISPKILCLAGNHDHHLWNAARETRYNDQYLAAAPVGQYLKQEYYVTRMVEGSMLKKIPVEFLEALIHRQSKLRHVRFETVYPNYALINPSGTRSVIIHHGHFIESIYSLMTFLKDTIFPNRDSVSTLSELEAENGAWIDFFWSTLGRSGQVGVDVELIYDKMQDPHQFEALLRNLAANMAPSVPPKWDSLGPLKTLFICMIFRGVLESAAKREVHETGSALSPDAEAGLSRYLEVFLTLAIREENRDTIPPEVTFIFGHTHKPFESLRRAEGYSQPIQVFNSGGWVVDTLQPDPLHGAAIIVIDDELHCASIRLYNETMLGEPSKPSIGSALKGDPFVDHLKSGIDLGKGCWTELAQLASNGVREHRKNLESKVARK